MWKWKSTIRKRGTDADMIRTAMREELDRLGFPGSRSLPRSVYHAAIVQVCHRLLLEKDGH